VLGRMARQPIPTAGCICFLRQIGGTDVLVTCRFCWVCVLVAAPVLMGPLSPLEHLLQQAKAECHIGFQAVRMCFIGMLLTCCQVTVGLCSGRVMLRPCHAGVLPEHELVAVLVLLTYVFAARILVLSVGAHQHPRWAGASKHNQAFESVRACWVSTEPRPSAVQYNHSAIQGLDGAGCGTLLSLLQCLRQHLQPPVAFPSQGLTQHVEPAALQG